MTKKDTCMEYLRYEFTMEEVLDKGKELARKINEVPEAQSRKKAIITQVKEQEERAEPDIATLSRQVSNGYEYRHIECKILYHTPNAGMCTLVRLDTGEEVWQRAMTTEEHQEVLPLADPEPEAETPAQDAYDHYDAAVKIVQEVGSASTSVLQERLRINYEAAVGLIDWMEENGLVGPENGANPRALLPPKTASVEEPTKPQVRRPRGFSANRPSA